MSFDNFIKGAKTYFDDKFNIYGTTPQGVDWNSQDSQEIRFQQLTRIIKSTSNFSILDYGCGYGAYLTHLKKQGYQYKQFFGFDISESMIQTAKDSFKDLSNVSFTSDLTEVPAIDYGTASGVFNVKLDNSYELWTQYILKSIKEIDSHCTLGFAINFLTKYSDANRMRSDLYYADPCFLFDFCKSNFSKNVALLHDYGLYDFTLLIRKSL